MAAMGCEFNRSMQHTAIFSFINSTKAESGLSIRRIKAISIQDDNFFAEKY